MIFVGELGEICKHIENRFGSDSKVVIQIYDKVNKNTILVEGEDVLDYGWDDKGTLYLSNVINKEGVE